MRTTLKLISCLALSLASSSLPAWANPTVFGDPTSVKVTIYSVAVSKNTDCSEAVVVSKYASGQEFDFELSPTLMTGTLADGSYPCVILQMSDKLKLTPAT